MSLAFTLCTLFIGFVILIISIILGLIDIPPPTNEGWIRDLGGSNHFIIQIFGYLFTITSFIGVLPLFLFTGFGLSLISIGLIKRYL
jgi:hypothetical protein